jgi:hypothetical protein
MVNPQTLAVNPQRLRYEGMVPRLLFTSWHPSERAEFPHVA